MKQSAPQRQEAAYNPRTQWLFNRIRAWCGLLMTMAGLTLFALPGAATANDWRFGFAEDEAPISDAGPRGTQGILPDLATELFYRLPGEALLMEAGPWVRMQRWVETGQLDGLVTYPSEERRRYAQFSETPVFTMDFGYLIYRHDHPQRDLMEAARSFEDLADLVFIGQRGAEWERDNIPASLKTVQVGQLDTMMHLLVRRQSGDFMVMPPEQAIAIARRLGYEGQVAYHPVNFIPNARIPFHVGLRLSHPGSDTLIERIDGVLRSPGYQEAAERLLEKYR